MAAMGSFVATVSETGEPFNNDGVVVTAGATTGTTGAGCGDCKIKKYTSNAFVITKSHNVTSQLCRRSRPRKITHERKTFVRT
jgi:hypothetical protein